MPAGTGHPPGSRGPRLLKLKGPRAKLPRLRASRKVPAGRGLPVLVRRP